MLVAFCGLIGSGKDTAADYLVDTYGFKRDSFANTLKDAVSAIFGWDRTLLEGRTAISREWREQVDPWWATRLNISNLTPRWVLQYWGTDVCRVGFHDDIWIASLENKIRKTQDDIVISDVRFPNEINAIHNAGGTVIRIKRGTDPLWYSTAIAANSGNQSAKDELIQLGIHSSETSWIGEPIDYTVINDTTMADLFDQINDILAPADLPLSAKIALDLI